jgi:hypothetical protein
MEEYRATIEVTALTACPDLLHELFRSIVAEGLAQYHEWGELDPFQRLTVHVTSPHGERYTLIEYRIREENTPSEQLTMPGM